MDYLALDHLTKIYDTDGNKKTALEGVCLRFGPRGMVFVIGKSGSGKSTLLNLIGGLDEITSGTVVLKGKDYRKFKDGDFDALRSYEVGFIFQDFCLLDELTVFENIALASSLHDESSDEEAVLNAIKDVGLEGFEKQPAKFLSAGQRQRVAIARAKIKQPEILLCDEPTGNLDFQTSHEILKLLRGISKKSLVIIVSHNLEDAYVFADRIVELSDGHVVGDKENKNHEPVVGDTAYISGIDFMSEENLALVNEKLAAGKVSKIRSKRDLFVPYEHKEMEFEEKRYPKKHISLGKSFSLINRLLRKQFAKIGLFSFVIALLASVFSVCYMFIDYHTDTVYRQIAEQSDAVSPMFRKAGDGVYSSAMILPLEEKDLSKIKQACPNDTFYPLAAMNPFWSAAQNIGRGYYPIYDGSVPSSFNTLVDNRLHYKEPSGVLLCDEDFVAARYGQTELTYAAKADVIKDEGIYLTDYVVDEYFGRNLNDRYVEKTHEEALGWQSELALGRKRSYNRFYINGVIQTDYKTRFADVLEELENLRKNNPMGLKAFSTTERFYSYLYDAYSEYGMGYSFNSGFTGSYASSTELGYAMAYRAVMTITMNGEEATIHDYENTSLGSVGVTARFIHLNPEEGYPEDDTGTVYFPYNVLNSIYNSTDKAEDWNETLKGDPHIRIRLYDVTGKKTTLDKKYRLVVSPNASLLTASRDVVQDIAKVTMPYADIVFADKEAGRRNFARLSDLGYASFNISTSFPNYVNRGVDTYHDFFVILLVFSMVALLFVTSFVSFNNVRRFTYEIGVIKSMGASFGDTARIFCLQEFYLLLASVVLTVVGVFIATSLSNFVLAAAFGRNFSVAYSISILTLSPWVFFAATGMTVLMSLIAMVVPLIQMKRLKPIRILKAKY